MSMDTIHFHRFESITGWREKQEPRSIQSNMSLPGDKDKDVPEATLSYLHIVWVTFYRTLS